MFIKTLTIKNFRSIKALSIEPKNLCALIGPNGCGKTNILRALDLVLGEGWTTKAKVARHLFHDPLHPITIEVNFDSPIEFENKKGYQVSVSSIKLEMTLDPELSAKTTINGGETFYDQDKFKRLCHFILVPSERQLTFELSVSHWTMLGKLMKLIYENYISKYSGDEQNLKNDFAEKIKGAKEFLEDDFSTDEVTFNKFVNTFKKHCKENSSGLANEFEPVLDIYNLNWFYKTLQIHVKENFPDRHFDCEDVGTGMQNLLLVSIFQTYAELMGGKVIFGIEEPEIYLYPPAQRALYNNFIELSRETQIFYTTHNPNFVSASRPDDIVLIRKEMEYGTYKLEKDRYFNSQTAADEFHRIYTHFNPERNELFFAKKVLLVEGDSDKILFITLCKEKWHFDLDNTGVIIISCGGKGGVNYFVGICKLIGLNNYFAIWDQDPGEEYKPKVDLLSDLTKTSRGLEIKENLEKYLGLPSSDEASKIKNAYEWAKTIEEAKIPTDFNIINDFLKDQTTSTPVNKKQKNQAAEVMPVEDTTEDANIELDDIPF